MKDSAVREILFSYQKKRDKAEYEFASVDGNYVEGKVYVIDDGAYATMLWAEEY